jgi:hypothetical protein
MKQSFLLYTCILITLLAIFTFSYYSSQLKFETSKFEKKLKTSKDSIAILKQQLFDANYFSLENNQNAQDYFYSDDVEKSISYEKLIPIVKEKLFEFNDNPAGNPYTGQDKLGDNKFIINKIMVLNHRWIIADYSDGNYWGEVLLKYFVNEDKSISFELIQTLLYQK